MIISQSEQPKRVTLCLAPQEGDSPIDEPTVLNIISDELRIQVIQESGGILLDVHPEGEARIKQILDENGILWAATGLYESTDLPPESYPC